MPMDVTKTGTKKVTLEEWNNRVNKDIANIIAWINEHEKLTLPRFDEELAALIRHPESKARKALEEIQANSTALSLGSSTGGNLIQ